MNQNKTKRKIKSKTYKIHRKKQTRKSKDNKK